MRHEHVQQPVAAPGDGRREVLTGGGDAPGLNAVIRAVVKTATCEYGMRVIGIEDGFEGLMGETKTRLLSAGDVRGLLPRGGTILGTRNRGNFVTRQIKLAQHREPKLRQRRHLNARH